MKRKKKILKRRLKYFYFFFAQRDAQNADGAPAAKDKFPTVVSILKNTATYAKKKNGSRLKVDDEKKTRNTTAILRDDETTLADDKFGDFAKRKEPGNRARRGVLKNAWAARPRQPRTRLLENAKL